MPMEDPGGLRDTLAHYWTAYHQEVRRQLSSLSVYGIDTIPSHLMPGKRLIRTWETSDGHFLVEHISNPSTSYSDLYEDYLHTWPPRDQTLGELTGVELRDDAPLLVSRVFGKRQHDPGYDQAAMADYVERRDVISRAKVLELTEEEARRQATADLKPYIA
jgi:hypothetical protein